MWCFLSGRCRFRIIWCRCRFHRHTKFPYANVWDSIRYVFSLGSCWTEYVKFKESDTSNREKRQNCSTDKIRLNKNCSTHWWGKILSFFTHDDFIFIGGYTSTRQPGVCSCMHEMNIVYWPPFSLFRQQQQHFAHNGNPNDFHLGT